MSALVRTNRPSSLNVKTSSGSSKPPSRPLPPGPGPLDANGKPLKDPKILRELKDSIRPVSSATSRRVPVRADHALSSSAQSSPKILSTSTTRSTPSTTAASRRPSNTDSSASSAPGETTSTHAPKISLNPSSQRDPNNSNNSQQDPLAESFNLTISLIQSKPTHSRSTSVPRQADSSTPFRTAQPKAPAAAPVPDRGSNRTDSSVPVQNLRDSNNNKSPISLQFPPLHSRTSPPACNPFEKYNVSASKPACGLRNLGNTCFMNSVVQCLGHTKPFLVYCLSENFEAELTRSSQTKGMLFSSSGDVLKKLWTSSAPVNPSNLKFQAQRLMRNFSLTRQQDAQEFLIYFRMGLHEEVNKAPGKARHSSRDPSKLSEVEAATGAWNRYLEIDNSRLVDMFVGQLRSNLECATCGHSSVTFDPFWDLSLPIPKHLVKPVTLQSCLQLYTDKETLDGDEKPSCERCNRRQKHSKSLSIYKFPKILVLHLKRFTPDGRKLEGTIEFPERLDLKEYAAESAKDCYPSYQLYAVSNHSGTVSFGHYTAYCRHPVSGQWFLYDDARVDSVNSSRIVSQQAYILFYEMI